MTPVLSDDQMKEAVDKFRKHLKSKKADIVFDESWGLRKLAYPIQKKSTGFYHLFEYKMDGQELQEFEVLYKRDERILRFLTVKLDKHAIAYNEKKRKKAAAEKAVEEEA
jgi:small subunit ribosomal protein S6